ncbi:hypothetical protein A3B56_02720 [Candidatus Roizmanbacteria bacterium RIFCSPLOWO2_01_FULL_45_11]|uniref:Capsular polysaccharide assembling protein CapF C-terminal domain-containing protein n=1 Tax=Candidatus Roizmanbacteria bacterium RIFCSPLOWO2_01_FULL_45_11 TaxID=1802070 RepID=A0A1F7JCR8_9BACT|nr:MAG: hypothetical protein A3B56_02720 [Candidatus Roizmanbacteria bacterium RIFCSPLOWO2_01_FULL_45_11]
MKLNIKKLDVKRDDRGWLAEIIRPEDVGYEKFGQILISTALPGKTKGCHYHKRKREWYCLIQGTGLLTVTDRKTGEKIELTLSDKDLMLVEIPTGFLHSLENTGDNELILMAYLDESFDPNDPDVYQE